MPKTTKTPEEQLAEVDGQIKAARLREQGARLQREKLENRRSQLLLRAGKSEETDAVEVEVAE